MKEVETVKTTETAVELTEAQVAEAKAITDKETQRATQIDSLNKILAKFARANNIEIGELTLQKNDRISASFVEKVDTPSKRINSSDLSNFIKAKNKFNFSDVVLGEKFNHYGSIKPKSNHVKVTEFEVVSARPMCKGSDIIIIERIENGIRTNVSVDKLNEMKLDKVSEEEAGIKNGTHKLVTEGKYKDFVMPINYKEDLEDVEDVEDVEGVDFE